MNAEEFAMARQLLAEETVGQMLRAKQRQIEAEEAAEDATHQQAMAALRAREG